MGGRGCSGVGLLLECGPCAPHRGTGPDRPPSAMGAARPATPSLVDANTRRFCIVAAGDEDGQKQEMRFR